jgi:hypothetical protein
MRARLFSLLITVLAMWVAPALGQDTSSITGLVRDSAGAALVGARVVVSDTAAGIKRVVTTNSSGEYLVPGLPQGVYDIEFSANGFSAFKAAGFALSGAQKARLDASLRPGAVQTEVVVQGENTTHVDVESAEMSSTITSTEINQLELNGRNYAKLVLLTPGVRGGGGDEARVGVNGNVGFNVNGGRSEYNHWSVDGGDVLDNGSNTTLNLYNSLESIAEVRVLTSNYGAQYGLNGSGSVEVITKGGSNHLHGSAYYFVGNDILNARSFNQPVRPPYKRNNFGYTVGGPVTIPGVYNSGKDKTFFFWSQEWRLNRTPNQYNEGVPSAAERNGDFSDICAPSSSFFGDCPTLPSGGTKVQTIDPNAQALMKMIPLPNAPGSSCGSIGCFVASFSAPEYWREDSIRLDHNLSQKHRVMFRFTHDSWNTVLPSGSGFGLGTSAFDTIPTNEVGPGVSIVAHLNSNFSSSLVNEFVASYNADHIHFSFANGAIFQRPSSMTMTGLFNNGFGGKLPGVILTGNTVYGFMVDPSFVPWDNSAPTYNYRDNIYKIVGKHNLTFGAAYIAFQKNEPGVPDVQGLLTFDASNGDVSTGNSFADMLMGNIASYSQTNTNPKYFNRYKIFEPYIQDDWHVTPHLTLNAGIRVSLFGTYREILQQGFNWQASAYDPKQAPQIDPNGFLVNGVGNGLDGIVQCGVGKSPAGCMSGHLFNPAPRLGFAWSPWGTRTSIRGGYGIFFEHGNGNEANSESLEATPPLSCTATQNSIPGYTSIGGSGGGVNACGGAGQIPPLAAFSIPTKAIWPYVQQWNLNVEREIIPKTVLTVAYVGSKGTHLNLQRDINQLFPVPASLNPFKPGEAISKTVCKTKKTPSGVPITGQALTNLDVACGDSADPFRPFQGISDITLLENEANSSYNALQGSLRRTAGPLVLSVAYTYSHSIDDSSDRFDGSFVNSYNLAATRASSNFDQRHLLHISYVYDLPGLNTNGFTKTALSGWQLSGITLFETGTPFSINPNAFGDAAGVGNAVGRGAFADVVGDPHGSTAGIVARPGAIGPLLFNSNAFVNPTGLTFGNSGRNFLNRPNRTNFDMGLYKRFKIRENTNFELRAEAFNVFNHTEFTGVNSTVGRVNFLRPSGAHQGRVMSLGGRLSF